MPLLSPLLSLLQLFIFIFSSCSIIIIISCCAAPTTVTHLPGFSGPLPFHLETGYVKVDDGVELYYYFIESERNSGEDPLLLWLTGGPGCSSLCGLVIEVGPLRFRADEYNGSLPTLLYDPLSWTKVSNIIFLDSPVGTGFSFSRRSEGYEAGDISSSKQAHKFLMKWFVSHPQFLSNPLYIAGDSYAGKVIPVIAQEISEGIDAGYQPQLNLKGYLMGNPVTGENGFDLNARVPYAHGMGIISHELYEAIKSSCEGEDYDNPRRVPCAINLQIFDKFLSEIQKSHILEPKCINYSDRRKEIVRNRSLKENYTKLLIPPPPPPLYCRSYAYFLQYYWANNHEVREALNIKKGTVLEWHRCNESLLYTEDVSSSIKYHFSLTSRGYRALVYSGDQDMKIPFLGTQAWIRSLNFPIVDEWRSWHVGGQVAGYTRAYSNNLTFATVKGAGHCAPEYKPKECLAMFRRWISQKPL